MNQIDLLSREGAQRFQAALLYALPELKGVPLERLLSSFGTALGVGMAATPPVIMSFLSTPDDTKEPASFRAPLPAHGDSTAMDMHVLQQVKVSISQNATVEACGYVTLNSFTPRVGLPVFSFDDCVDHAENWLGTVGVTDEGPNTMATYKALAELKPCARLLSFSDFTEIPSQREAVVTNFADSSLGHAEIVAELRRAGRLAETQTNKHMQFDISAAAVACYQLAHVIEHYPIFVNDEFKALKA